MQSHLAIANINPFAINSIEAYKKAIQSIPTLSAEEEYNLAKELQEKNCIKSAQSLILSHLRFVAHIAKGYSGYGLPEQDIIQEGNIGLMKAVKRFDPTQGVRLVSFAVHWIKAEIHEYVIKNWRIVKIATTKAQRKLFFNLRKNKSELGWFNDDEAQHLADKLNVSKKDVYSMESRMGNSDQAFDIKDADEDDYSPSQFLIDHDSDLESYMVETDSSNKQEIALKNALMQLSERDRDIVTQRWLNEEKATLNDLATKYNVSGERVRQIEKEAMKKMKEFLH